MQIYEGVAVRKAPPLVCQFLENVSRDALEKYQDVIREFVRHRHGIYALYRRNRLYYVGLAKDLRWRLKQHLRDRHGASWDRFSVYITIGDRHLRELESLVLRITKPKGNEITGKFKRAENLKRALRRAIRMQHRAEIDALFGRLLKATSVKQAPKNGRTPMLAPYVRSSFRIRAFYKGKTYKAKVRKDGSIRFQKETYTSPSSAASSVLKRASDGWYFWRYERGPGDWVRLNELRR